MNPIQTISYTAGGYESTWPTRLTELTGDDISIDTVQMVVAGKVLGADPDWIALDAPHTLTAGTISAKEFMIQNPSVRGVQVPDGQDPATVTLHWVEGQLFIAPTGLVLAVGEWWPYIQIGDNPASPIRRGQKFNVI